MSEMITANSHVLRSWLGFLVRCAFLDSVFEVVNTGWTVPHGGPLMRRLSVIVHDGE